MRACIQSLFTQPLLCLAIVLSFLLPGSSRGEELTYGDLKYDYYGSGVRIIGYTGSPTALTIPSTINGYQVIAIGQSAFQKCSSLTSVSIPNSVTSIGSFAFYTCTSLTTVNIPSGVTSIKDYTFAQCWRLIIPTIPNTVTSIGSNAFDGCSGTRVTIPSSVTSIGVGAFDRCDELSKVFFQGNAPTTFQDGAFRGNAVGFTIYYNASATGFSMPTWMGFNTARIDYTYDKLLCTYDTTTSPQTVIICGYTGKPVSLSIPKTINGYQVSSIRSYAFYGCESLARVIIPSGVTSLGAGAFSNCETLFRAIFLGDAPTLGSATVFGGRANWGEAPYFKILYNAGATGFTSPKWNGYDTVQVDYTENNLLYTYDSGVSPQTAIVSGYIGSPTAVTIPNTVNGYKVTSIANDAFANCETITSITIPDGVTSIGSNAFFWSMKLVSIGIPSSCTSIGKSAFQGCIKLTSITIPDGVTKIGRYMFWECEQLKSINLPDSISEIEESGFTYCSGLTSITFGNKLTSIGDSAFWCCTGLTSVTIPASVTSITYNAFGYCTQLSSAYFMGNAPTFSPPSGDIFANTASNFAIYFYSNFTGFTTPTWKGYRTVKILTALDTWRSTRFTTDEITNHPEISGDMATPANDGIPNLMKYALALDPKTPATTGLPVSAVQSESDALTLSFTQLKSAPDIVYIPEVTTDLVNWSSDSSSVSIVQTSDNGSTQTVTVKSQLPLSSNSKQYIRLRVVKR